MQEISRDFLRSRYQCVTLWTCHNYYGITKRFGPSCVAWPVTTINYLSMQRMRQSPPSQLNAKAAEKNQPRFPRLNNRIINDLLS